MRVYFDTWGNRCYLFNSITGNYMRLQKGNTLVYEGLEFDMEALRELGCEYLFSGAEIGDADRMGMELVGYFETEDSYWGSGCIDCNSSAHRMTESLPCVQAPRHQFCHPMAELLPQLS